MKKLFALLTILCLLCSCCAFADEPVEFSWEEVEEDAAKYPGSIQNLGVYSMGMYIPDSFQAVEITEEQKATGIFFILQDEAGYRLVGTYQSLGDNNVEYLIDELQKAGATGISEISINELPAIEYDLLTPDGVQSSSLVYFNANDNTFLTISFAPIDNEDFQEVVKIIMASIQLVSEAE